MSFLYRKIKPGPDAEWTVKDLDTITFEAVELSFENSSGTEVVNIAADGTLTADVTGDVTGDILGSLQTLSTLGDVVQIVEKTELLECGTGTTAATTTLSVPVGALLIGSSLNVEVAITTDNEGADTWGSAYSGGSTATIGTASAATKNTKVKTFFDANAATAITATNPTQITLTPVGESSPKFTAGSVRCTVFYAVLKDLADA